MANSTAETERRWTIRGTYPDGKKLQFSVNAFDHSDAKKKAETQAKRSMASGANITDIVLQDSMNRADKVAAFADGVDRLASRVDALAARADGEEVRWHIYTKNRVLISVKASTEAAARKEAIAESLGLQRGTDSIATVQRA